MSKRRLAFAQSVRKTEALAKNHHEAWFDSWSSRIYRFKNTELLVVHIFAVSAPIWSCMWSGRVLQAGIACQTPTADYDEAMAGVQVEFPEFHGVSSNGADRLCFSANIKQKMH